ncbi:MAG: hypothetical protein K2P78_01400, partial [Gemmataceae bacterium]|nr:hypothetical protein [Gemmataceae bacterium]
MSKSRVAVLLVLFLAPWLFMILAGGYFLYWPERWGGVERRRGDKSRVCLLAVWGVWGCGYG